MVRSNGRRTKRSSYLILLCSFLIFITACAHQVSGKQLTPTFEFLRSKTSKPLKQVSYVGIEQKIRRFESHLREGAANSNAALALHDELLEAYISLKENSAAKITIPAHSQKRIPLRSFCLNSGKASPSANEHYRWVKKLPNIPYYREVLEYWFQHQKIPQQSIQTLLWNLENETHFENYSPDLQRILLEIDKNAPVKLPSEAKGKITDFASGLIKSVVPEIETAQDAFRWVKGPYRDYREIADSVRSLRSKETIPVINQPQIVEGTPLFAETDSEGFSSVDATLYNPSDEEVSLDLADYNLEPSRKDVQNIGILPTSPEREGLMAALERVLYGDMARLGIGFVPVLNDVADLYELITGKDYLSGKSLTASDRALAGIGVIFGSGANYRWMKRAAHSPAKYFPEFEKGLEKAAGREVVSIEQAGARAALEKGERSAAQIRETPVLNKIATAKDFKKTNFYVRDNGDVIPAKGYRYYGENDPRLPILLKEQRIPPKAEGTYITFDSYGNAEEAARKIQVPHEARYKVEFDTKQILDDVKVPWGKSGSADYPEPRTRDFPKYGEGGATQAITSRGVKIDRIIDLETGKATFGR